MRTAPPAQPPERAATVDAGRRRAPPGPPARTPPRRACRRGCRSCRPAPAPPRRRDARARPSRTIDTAWAAAAAGSSWTAPGEPPRPERPVGLVRPVGEASARRTRSPAGAPRRSARNPPSTDQDRAETRATARRSPRPRPDPRAARVVERAVRLDVAERTPVGPSERRHRARPGRRSTPPARRAPCRGRAARTRRGPGSRDAPRPRRRATSASRTVRSIVSGSPAWAPQATLTLVTSGMRPRRRPSARARGPRRRPR